MDSCRSLPDKPDESDVVLFLFSAQSISFYDYFKTRVIYPYRRPDLLGPGSCRPNYFLALSFPQVHKLRYGRARAPFIKKVHGFES
jgi:hypothetical protein